MLVRMRYLPQNFLTLRLRIEQHCTQNQFFKSDLKGLISVISSNPACTDDNVRFILVPFKALSDLYTFYFHVFNCGFQFAHFYTAGNQEEKKESDTFLGKNKTSLSFTLLIS